MPSSLQASIWPCCSASRENSEYSICREASGCTVLPRRSDSAEHSESEMKRVLPSLTSSAMPPTLSSTGIAAERTSRRCFGIELDPAYVDTIIRRWQKRTGEAARHGVSGRAFDDLAC